MVPARAMIMLIRDEARDMTESMWGEKKKWVSKLTPSMWGLLSRGNKKTFLISNMAGINIFYIIFTYE